MPRLSLIHCAPVLAALVLACGGEPPTAIQQMPPPAPPLTGSLLVGSTTSGALPDPDGYAVYVDQVYAQFIGPNDSTRVDGLRPGSHTLRLDAVSSNCSVADSSFRTVTVRPAETTRVDILVRCVTPVAVRGNLEVGVRNSGAVPAQSSFSLKIAGCTFVVADLCWPYTRVVSLSEGSNLTIPNLSPVSHTLTLTAATNCTITSANPLKVKVVAGQTVSATFEARCQ